MNGLQSRDGKISIHEPLTVDQDNPGNIFARDILKRQFLAERILNRLLEDNCPHVLGIYGGWGTGKTSLINLLIQLHSQSSGQQSKRIYIENIDAWKYESSDGLLRPVVVRLKKLAGNEELPEVWKPIVKRVMVATALSVTDALLKKFADVDRKQIKETYEEVAAHDVGGDYVSILNGWEQQSDEIENTQGAFEKLVALAAQKKQCSNIVICIDNLDRCTPENVVRLLESVKVFFDVPHCTWVFAMDSDVVASYVNHKYEGVRMDGNSYLDKIIPEQYHLSLSPATDGRNIVSLLRYAAGGNLSDLDEEKIPQIPKALVPRRLIKSAGKVSDFYRTSYAGSTSFETVFNLTLLYHTWPDFYQRFSSTSNDHICGILDNFFSTDEDLQREPKPGFSKTNRDIISLDKKYTEDHDLFHFLKTAFKDYKDSRNVYVDEIINGMMGLRLTGLP